MDVLDILFPKRCVSCGKVGRYFCQSCQKTIRFIGEREAICPVCEKPAIDGGTHFGCRRKYAIDGLTSFFRYDGPTKAAIKAIKYRLVWDLSAEFCAFIPNYHILFIRNLIAPEAKTALLPIPLHGSRYKERGFNQAAVLGNIIAKRLAIPTQTAILTRTKKTVPQVQMQKREARMANMRDVFAVTKNPTERPASVFLFDDVFTTGATMCSAANVLKRAGANWVWGITMAR